MYKPKLYNITNVGKYETFIGSDSVSPGEILHAYPLNEALLQSVLRNPMLHAVELGLNESTVPENSFVSLAGSALEEQAIQKGLAFSTSTGVQSVDVGKYLNCVLLNPANSGKSITITKRLFFNDRVNGTLEYGQMLNPYIQPDLMNTAFIGNLRSDGGPSVCNFMFSAELDQAINMDPPRLIPIGGILPLNGIPFEITTHRVLTPGQSFGYYVGGAGRNLATSARIAVILIWFEEEYNGPS